MMTIENIVKEKKGVLSRVPTQKFTDDLDAYMLLAF